MSMTSDQAPLILVVDDDDAMRGSVAFLFASVGLDSRQFKSAEEFLAARDALPKDRPGCLLLDVRMPGMSGLELQRRLNEEGFGLPMLMVSGHGDIPMAVAALKGGAEDFIEKPYRDQHLLDAVHLAIRKSRERLSAGSERSAVVERFQRLTRREREVLMGVLAGKQNKTIAQGLDISIKTVEVHRHTGMEKMAAGSVAELSRMILLAGILVEAD
ncbi:response regulator transcription factor [Telmatospirillum siberiense]|uniref:DNA-binding response regulator n=1 Tax=Telmatospirillum siberiense TaxID=382514 RepID=A0A2N3PRW5_9PROT|nr:response regulator [Telmatospirillum siberiense]PKU23147.1 DNA-binding response regulator [Telmatospirillum siberiense]